jgi:hypothetical protein
MESAPDRRTLFTSFRHTAPGKNSLALFISTIYSVTYFTTFCTMAIAGILPPEAGIPTPECACAPAGESGASRERKKEIHYGKDRTFN